LKLCEASFLNFSQNTTMDMSTKLSFNSQATQTERGKKSVAFMLLFLSDLK